MKKNLIVATLLLMSFRSFAQSEKLPSTFDRDEIVPIINSKNKLFINAQLWVAKTFGDYNAVVQFVDKEQGKIVIKGKSDIDNSSFPEIKYIIIIDVRDNKYRYSISNILIGVKSVKNSIPSYSSPTNVFARIMGKKNELDELVDSKAKGTGGNDVDDKIFKANIYYKSDLYGIEKIDVALQDLATTIKIAMTRKDDF